jgi:ankyrin repeat protein
MLHYCVINHLKGLCSLFLDRGADPNGVVEVAIDSDDKQCPEILQVTPLTFAILNGYVDLTALLYARGADLNKQLEHKPEGREYPLCCAIASLHSTNPEVSLSSRKQIIKFLLMNGATECTRNILLLNTQTNEKSPLDPSDPEDLATIRLLLEEENFEECIEYDEEALILKVSFDAYEPDEIGYVLGSSNDQEQSE